MADQTRQLDGDSGSERAGRGQPVLLSLLGIKRRHGKRIPIRPNWWGWMLLALVVLFGGGIVFAEYSMQPDFCRSCHIMEPYYKAWHESTHRDVPCGDCHFEPGWEETLRGKFEATSQAVKYITNTYGSKPHADVRDESCLRSGCHEHRLLDGTVAWETKTERGDPITIHFNHTPHLGELRRGKRLRCVSCHSQIVQGQHIVVTLDTCFLCHFKDKQRGRDADVVGGCTSCHGAPKEEIRLATGTFYHADYVDRGIGCTNCHADSIRGDGDVPQQLCWTCHNNPTQIARYGEPGFLHRMHVTDNKIECASCHIRIEHYLDAGTPRTHQALTDSLMLDHGGTCSQCHDASHAGPDEMYRGTGGRGVPNMPSPMFRAQVDCVACHDQPLRADEVAQMTGQAFGASQRACDRCHGVKYAERLELWRATLAEQLDAAELAVEVARLRLEEGGGPIDASEALRLRRLLDDAEQNVRFVRLARGVHNMNYATALLSVAQEYSGQIVKTLDEAQAQ